MRAGHRKQISSFDLSRFILEELVHRELPEGVTPTRFCNHSIAYITIFVNNLFFLGG